jgi:hypothetical protein
MSLHGPIAEYAIDIPLVDVQALAPGEREHRLVQAGIAGTVVLVYSEGPAPVTYEGEFPLGGGNGALPTIPAAQLECAPEGYRRACPCCGYRTLCDLFPGSYEICPVCFWEDDLVQFEDPNQGCGANHVSLMQARKKYVVFGACEKEALPHVRRPLASEVSARK